MAYVNFCIAVVALSLAHCISGEFERIDTVNGEHPVEIFYESARESFVHARTCVQYTHDILFFSDDNNCNGTAATVSCRGKCVSETYPKFYNKK